MSDVVSVMFNLISALFPVALKGLAFVSLVIVFIQCLRLIVYGPDPD
jgi:hypothetical protein